MALRWGADFLEHMDDRLVGAAVQRAFQRANGGGDRRVDVGKRGDGDQRGEGRGVEAVVGMEDVGEVEGLDRFGTGRFAGEEIEEMGRFIEVGADGRKGLALARAMEVGDDDADFGRQRDGAGQKLLRGLRTNGRDIVEAEH